MDRNCCGRGIGAACVATLAALAVAAAAAPGWVFAQAPARGTAVLPKAKGLPPPTIPGSAQKIPGQFPASAGASGMSGGGGATSGASGKGATGSVRAAGQELDEVMSFKTNFEKDVKCVPLPLNSKISVDFEEAPLYDVLKFIACITQRNYLLGTNMKQGKSVTILSTTPVTVYEAYKAFLSALDINGLTVIPSGPFYKIIETAKAKSEPVPIFGSREDVPEEDRLITRIIALRYIDVKDIEPVLNKFKTGAGDISSYAPANSLIVTDMGRNVVRMLKFIGELDIPTGREKIWVRPVQYANATDMANLVTSLFGDKAGKGGGSAGRAPSPSPKGAAGANAAAAVSGGEAIDGPSTLSKVIADERTNQLIIVATPSAYLKIDHLLRRMDMPIEGEGQIHIYYLENAAAEDVASTLSSLTSGGGAKKSAAGGKAGGGGAPSAASLFSGEVKITAHKATNSLVIESSLKDYLSVKRVVQQIDVRRKQVYVEAVIMEISSNKDRKLGISASDGASVNIGGNDVPLMLGMGGLGISGLDMQQLNKGGLAMGLTGPLLDVSTGTTGSASTAGSLSLPSYGFLIQAFQANSDVNILSTPHILTTDNEEAEIVVGKTIPYQASSTGNNSLSSLLGGSSGLGSLASAIPGASSLTGGLASSLMGSGGLGGYGSNYVQRIDVDLTLKITPQISESNFVKLKINQQIDDVESLDATLGPTTSKRKVSNTVVVRDQQPVVIGGLMRDMEVTGVDKVPFLGDIPLLGVLFRKTATRTEKRNLLMIITPYIIEDPSDLRRIHEQKMDEMQKFAEYMSAKKKEAAGNIDYRKKTGVMEDIRKTMDRVRKDRDLLEQTRFDEVDRVGAPETHDLEYDPFTPIGNAPGAAAGDANTEVSAGVVPQQQAPPAIVPPVGAAGASPAAEPASPVAEPAGQ